jgi:hypothetical protein
MVMDLYLVIEQTRRAYTPAHWHFQEMKKIWLKEPETFPIIYFNTDPESSLNTAVSIWFLEAVSRNTSIK